MVVYAPVKLTDRDSSESDKFYWQLQESIERVQGRNIVFHWEILTHNLVEIGIEGILSLGKFGMGKENSNGYRLHQFR